MSRGAFREMVEVVRPYLDRPCRRGGQAKLSVEGQILVADAYWREYRSQFHIGVSWGLHETTVGRIVRKVEDLLVKSGFFSPSSSASVISARMGVEGDGGRCRRGRD